ncbi:hypothetical protein AK812_SmicGene2807 [Symbiodinium microadriaticum]|uniref:Uncharacterized protein n=1 Tax=Symbiodinium microadriaticum TaxID=2951 RepID=A0A1Q9F0J9_SYMMI|nr:hypothetical protein AK812_SmicGene2807 [Symbiodinium microadriaticum]
MHREAGDPVTFCSGRHGGQGGGAGVHEPRILAKSLLVLIATVFRAAGGMGIARCDCHEWSQVWYSPVVWESPVATATNGMELARCDCQHWYGNRLLRLPKLVPTLLTASGRCMQSRLADPTLERALEGAGDLNGLVETIAMAL